MTANTYEPQTNLTPSGIARPKGGAMPNHPLPPGVRVERRESGAVNSANEGAGGYLIVPDASLIKR
jgi:hypothetical protein